MPAKWPPRAVGEPTIAIVVDAAGGKDVLGAEVGVIVMAGAQGNHIHRPAVNRPIG
jgi:hypothetical protein